MHDRGSYDAWLIDLDGTLYWQTPVRLLMAAELVLLAPHRIRTVRRFRQEQERIRREPVVSAANGCPYEVQLDRTAAALKCSPASVAAVIHQWMERRPGKWLHLFRRRGLLDEIAAFRAAGGKTALVSDYPAATKLAGMGIAGLFDVVVANGETGGPAALKPDPAGYLQAAALLGSLPAKCLVIGDRDNADGEAARQAGMAFRHVR